MPTVLWKALFQANTTDDPGPFGHATATNEQSGSDIVALTGDRVFVAWNDLSTNFSGGLEPPDSAGQILDPLGNLDGGETYLSGVFGDGAQTNVDIAALPNGGFVAAYQTQDFNFGTHGENIGFQVFDADGNVVFSRASGTLNDPGSTSGVHQLDNERDPSVVAFADGSFMIVYEDDSAGNSDIRGVVIDSTGAEQPSFTIDAAAAEATRPDAVTLSNGDMAMVYQSAGASGDILFGVRTNTGGAVAAGTVAGGASNETAAAVAALRGPGGGFVVAWADADGDAAGNAGIKIRLYSNAGVAAGAAVSANLTVTAGTQSAPTVTGLLDGGFIVAWVDEPSGDIRARRFDASGAAIETEFVIASLDTLSQPHLTTLEDGRIAVSVTNTDGAADQDIYAAIWDPRGSPHAGTAGDDVLTTRPNGGTIQGLGGNDTIYSGPGDDTLDGGTDNDTANFSAATGGVSVNLGLTGAQAVGGGLGSDTLAGIENLIGTSAGDLLVGNNGVNTLTGNGGADVLNGAAGADTLIGGDSNDAYYIDALDTVTEGSGAGSGTDTIYARFNVDLGNYANVENLALYGSGSTSGIGTSGRNVLSALSNANGVTFDGLDGDDVLYGSNHADTLNGGIGRDILLGYAAGAGVNTLNGGADGDVYYSFATSDAINENLNEGFDIVYTTVNRTLSANTEYLYLYGAATSGTGNGNANTINGFNSAQSLTLDGAGGNDVIYGSNQDDIVIGGTGSDAMLGFGGNDRFRFAAAGTGADQIIGFDADPAGGQDLIDVSGRGFNAASIGVTIIVSADGADTLIVIGADSIRLSGINPADITSTDFAFV